MCKNNKLICLILDELAIKSIGIEVTEKKIRHDVYQINKDPKFRIKKKTRHDVYKINKDPTFQIKKRSDITNKKKRSDTTDIKYKKKI